MTDIINLNSIRSDNCDCNKPKPNVNTCGCHSCNQQTPSQAMNLGEQYFKVKNLFSELKSEWQRAEARSNLGISDIIGLEQTDESQESGGTNTWTLITQKGGIETKYKLFVRNGEKGESATIEIVSLQCNLPPDAEPVITNLGTKSHAQYMINLPRGKQGEPGEQGSPGIQGETGKSAYELAVQQGFMGSLDEWLASLKGQDGSQYRIKEITIAEVVNKDYELPNGETFSGKVAIWKVKLHNDTYFNFWAPLNVASGGNGGNGGNDQATDRYNVFLFTVKSYPTVPEDDVLNGTLISLRNNLSGLNEDQARANGDGWKSQVEVYDDGTNYVFMASCVVTNGVYGPWSVVRLTPKPGKQGSPGNPGSTSQGLIGPTIQMRGEYDNNTEYVNETYKPYSSNNEIHYIDVVFYKSSSDTGNWYSVKPGQPDGGGVKTKGNTPEDTRYWTKATAFDFAFINELITNQLRSRTIDAEEIRIHDTREEDGDEDRDIIVAGLTSGKPVTYHDSLKEELTYENTNSPVRIWAGTSFNTKGTDSNFDITTAKFRVHQNGYLHAEDAEITGTIQANTLRLGELENGNGTFKQAEDDNTITLPNLPGGWTQMFYLLTNNGYAPDIKPNINDNIQTPSGTSVMSPNTYQTSINKLYQCFGINHTWYIVEQDVKAASSIINNTDDDNAYGLKSLEIIIKDNWTGPTEIGEGLSGWVLQTQDVQGTLLATFKNNTNSPKTVHFNPQTIEVIYDAQGINPDLLSAPSNLQLITNVWYKLRVNLGEITIPVGGSTLNNSLVENYSMNVQTDHIRVLYMGFNGTQDNPYSVKPSIGTVNVNYPTIASLGSEPNSGDANSPYQKIILTNVPFTENN